MKSSKSSSDILSTTLNDWGPAKYGIESLVDSEECLSSLGSDVVIDVEDNEQGSFVGVGLYDGGKCVFYFTRLSQLVKDAITSKGLIAHNGKSDIHKLRSWGVNVNVEQLKFDTMLASYVQNSTKASQSLKDLAASELGISYPAYLDIVGTGKKKVTLDKHPVTLVAAYNGMDCLSTYRLWKLYDKTFSTEQRRYFDEIEMPTARLLCQMEEEGIQVDLPYLSMLDSRFGTEADRLRAQLVQFCGSGFNPASPAQVRERLLKRVGCNEQSTSKSVLAQFATIPIVSVLSRFREVEKLRGTYTTPLRQLTSADGRIHPTFNQVAMKSDGTMRGIRTGRLSCSDPNLQNIPDRTDTGTMLRKAFVAKPRRVLIDADYAQIEWRIAAHFSQDPEMIKAVMAGDPYTRVAEKAGISRGKAKTAMLAAHFGAWGPKIGSVIGTDDKGGWKFLDAYKASYPVYFKWREKLESQQYVTTIFGREIKPGNSNLNVPYMIQGSAADVIKTAMLRVTEAGYRPIVQVHDELIFEVPGALVGAPESCVPHIKALMEGVVKLAVPLVVDINIGSTWQEAKG